MSTDKPISLLRLEYDRAAEAYLRSLPPEHFMEATPQATQREIAVESLALVKSRRLLHALQQAENERRQKERLLAQLRELGIDPRL